jgi:hypothetical protein
MDLKNHQRVYLKCLFQPNLSNHKEMRAKMAAHTTIVGTIQTMVELFTISYDKGDHLLWH